jgi:hypothetical protein
MRVSKSMEEICRIKEEISAEIADMSDEEVMRYFREKRPRWVGPLRRFEKPEAPRTKAAENRS